MIIASDSAAHGGLMAFSMRGSGGSKDRTGPSNRPVKEGRGRTPHGETESFAAGLGLDAEAIVFCRQVHGVAVEIVESRCAGSCTSDALITPVPGIFPAVRTADCLPILMLDPIQRIAAAVHAGWKGTVLRIAGKVVRTMVREFGTDPTDVLVSLGPAIGPCCFEVDDAVLEPFIKSYPDGARFIMRPEGVAASVSEHLSAPTKPSAISGLAEPLPDPHPIETLRPPHRSRRLHLAEANRYDLIAAGIPEANIHTIDLCTACYSDLFFSYRRDKEHTGSQISAAGFSDGIRPAQ
ncbi:MAG: peptidoglycan editing factor PgeF [Pseudomonadota bacterium]